MQEIKVKVEQLNSDIKVKFKDVLVVSTASGIKYINENGVHDVRDFAFVDVFVSENTPQEKSVVYTENGEYSVLPDEDSVLTKVNVKVNVPIPSGGNDTSDATATANDILLGKTAYIADGKVEGTIETYDYSNSENSAQDIISNYISQINYIEGTGTQYLTTNYVATSSNITIEAKIKFTNLNINYAFWLHNINGKSGNQTDGIGLGKSDSNYAVAYSRINTTQEDPLYSNYKLEENVDYEIKAIYDSTNSTKTLYVNGELQKTKTYTADLTKNNQPFMLFYCAGFPIVSAKMYYLKIYSDNQLVVHLVPCIRKHDNIIGMFDLISATFYKSSGTEEFIGG